MTNLSPTEERKLYSIALALAVFTILYNLVEGIVATFFGYSDDTLTLFGFGVDSFIEMISGIGIAYMVLRIQKNPNANRSNFERMALHVTGTAFYLLVAGLIASAFYILYTGQKPVNTFWGVVISIISIVIMLVLIYWKIKVGKRLNSESILADAECTRVCIYMSIILLASSGLYELTHLPYIDAAGTIGLAWFSYREGKECFEKAASEKYCSHNH